MSYCRWSTDCFQCDVYVYESVYDCWTIHVANRRHYNPTVPPIPDEDHDSAEAWIAHHNAVTEWTKHPDTTLIDLPEDNEYVGNTYNCDSPGTCADMLELICDSGLNVPEYVIVALREEQTDLDNKETPDAEA